MIPSPTLRLDHNNHLIKGMPIKVREMMLRLCKNLSPTLRDYSTWIGSWLPTLTTTTNQPFGMHFKHVHILASPPCLPPLLGPRFLLAPKWEFDFDLRLCKKFHLSMRFHDSFSNIDNVHDAISWKSINLYFTCNLMWYICVIPYPTKRKVMSSSHFMFILLLCQSIMEFFFSLGHVPYLIHLPKMPLLDGILSSTLAPAFLVALNCALN
jgi:hypothetical protein